MFKTVVINVHLSSLFLQKAVYNLLYLRSISKTKVVNKGQLHPSYWELRGSASSSLSRKGKYDPRSPSNLDGVNSPLQK